LWLRKTGAKPPSDVADVKVCNHLAAKPDTFHGLPGARPCPVLHFLLCDHLLRPEAKNQIVQVDSQARKFVARCECLASAFTALHCKVADAYQAAINIPRHVSLFLRRGSNLDIPVVNFEHGINNLA
jgi:hypothetical protein